MDEQIVILIVYEAIMLILAFCLKIVTFKMANKAIAEKRLCTGIYHFFPVEGDRAVRLAKGYVSGVRIVFWFSILFVPFLFVISVFNGTIKL